MWQVEVSHKSEMAGPFNRGDTIINKHFTLLLLKEPTIRNSYQFQNVPSHKWQNWNVDNGSSILSGLVVKLNNSK